jgi:two-component system sensor histidine kinase NreB
LRENTAAESSAYPYRQFMHFLNMHPQKNLGCGRSPPCAIFITEKHAEGGSLVMKVCRRREAVMTTPDYQNKQQLYRILQAREDERKKISRELHDGVAQEIAGLQISLRQAKYQRNKDDILAVITQADEQLGKIHLGLRQFAAVLRPDVLEDAGLAAAFYSCFKRMEMTYKTFVRFEENIGSARYHPDLELAFYRAGQEAVLNACKYSGCQEIIVSLQRVFIQNKEQINVNEYASKNEDTNIDECGSTSGHGQDCEAHLCLEVEDHGRGFLLECPEVVGTGIGLAAMKEWTELVNGTLTIASQPEAGTSIRLMAAICADRGEVRA